ncbi:3-oxoacyl-ACP synthase [Burkholderia sp. Bp8963]|uniref:ketoacyl-ACP synthase III family protein n=1 Tax=Burkholderia sp. Bp8963 TaxID=2184547 RepID=UPI000F5958D5|nr:ketoacyl-ACP synthase III family protein [Burkholderia sp. Bp8963]RQS70485.1 3-oxoacyl-ACP synthase [Burkholderia sp. Bp8963]
MLTVEDICYVIPEQREDIAPMRDKIGLSDAEMKVYTRIYGLARVPVHRGPIEQMMTPAVRALIERNNVDPARVKYLVHCHTAQMTWPYMRSLPAEICNDVGLTHAVGFGMTASNCASTMVALRNLESLLSTDPDDDALAIVVTADQAFSRTLRWIPNTTFCGDAAAAMLLGKRDRGARLVALRTNTFGQHSRGIWQRREEAGEFDRTYPERLAEVMKQTLDDAGLEWSDIKVVFPHNVNLFSWQRVSKILQLPFERIFLDLLPETGHCFGADMLFNWAVGRERRQVGRGDAVMIATAGIGAVFAAAAFVEG